MPEQFPFGLLDAEGIWCETTGLPTVASRPALFLDRDGVVVEEVGYLHRAADVRLISGAAEVIRIANQRGVPVVMVTNQAGIGRGYYGWREFEEVQAALASALLPRGAHFDAVYACPYHPNGHGVYRRAHDARKPGPGMLLRAATALHLDLPASCLIGDKIADLQAARSAGLRCGVLVLTGHGRDHHQAAMELNGDDFQVAIISSILEAAAYLPLGNCLRNGSHLQ